MRRDGVSPLPGLFNPAQIKVYDENQVAPVFNRRDRLCGGHCAPVTIKIDAESRLEEGRQ